MKKIFTWVGRLRVILLKDEYFTGELEKEFNVNNHLQFTCNYRMVCPFLHFFEISINAMKKNHNDNVKL